MSLGFVISVSGTESKRNKLRDPLLRSLTVFSDSVQSGDPHLLQVPRGRLRTDLLTKVVFTHREKRLGKLGFSFLPLKGRTKFLLSFFEGIWNGTHLPPHPKGNLSILKPALSHCVSLLVLMTGTPTNLFHHRISVVSRSYPYRSWTPIIRTQE